MSQPLTSPEEQGRFARDGYVIIQGVYSPEEVKSLNREYEKIWLDHIESKQIAQTDEAPLGSLYPRLKDYHWKQEAIRDFVWKAEAVRRLTELLGEEILLISTNYYFKPPGSAGVPHHQDNYGIGVSPGTCYAVWVCLDETDAENGGMRFVPGTQTFDLLTPEKVVDDKADTFGGYVQVLQVPEGREVIELKTSPGDIVIYHGQVIHDSAENRTADRFRRSIISHFAGVGVERLLLNFNNLMDSRGGKVRKRLNTAGRDSAAEVK